MKKKIFVGILILIILAVVGFLTWRFCPKEKTEISGWQTYTDSEKGYAIQYPEDAKLEDLGYNLLGSVKISFDKDCYIGLDGGPFGFEDPDVEIDVTKDKVRVGDKMYERVFWKFLNRDIEDFAFISLDYPYDSNYPHFLIYHSVEPECLPRIDQILSTFKFID